MLRDTFGLKKFLPAILAALIILFTPLLQLLHLSGCSCEHSHHENFRIVANNILNIAVRNACKKNSCSSTSPKRNSHHQHDSKNCPVCQTYSAIYAGFNVPFSCNHLLLNTIYVQESVKIQSDVFSARIPLDISPRAPPVV